jgi:hypothetical protein
MERSLAPGASAAGSPVGACIIHAARNHHTSTSSAKNDEHYRRRATSGRPAGLTKQTIFRSNEPYQVWHSRYTARLLLPSLMCVPWIFFDRDSVWPFGWRVVQMTTRVIDCYIHLPPFPQVGSLNKINQP